MHKPVLIFNSVQHITVNVARSLYRKGIPVTFADIGAPGGRPTSRAIRDAVVLPHYQQRPEEFASELVRLIEKGGYDTILPCSDAGLVAVSDNYDRLSSLVYVGCPPPHVVKQVLDKDLTIEAARAVGVPVPVTHIVDDIEALDALKTTLRFPMIAKPRSKADERQRSLRVRYFATFQDLRDAFLTNHLFGLENLFQEYCAGEGVGIEVLLNKGEPLVLFEHRRLKELPVSGGGSVLCVSEAIDPTLADMALTLLRKLEWQGIAMVEFRHDPATKKATLMEVNGRYWGSLSLAISSGCDFPFYEWQLAHGQKPSPPESYCAGKRMRWFSGDVRRLASLFLPMHDGFPVPSRWEESVRFVKDSFLPAAHGIWTWTDPTAAIVELKQALRSVTASLREQVAATARHTILEYRELGWRNSIALLKIRGLSAIGLKKDRSASDIPRLSSMLFVCHGNKIRSPMAEALMRKHLGQMGEDSISVSSAGLISEPETHADPRARSVAREFGVSLDYFRPQRLTASLVDQADAIFIMDRANEARLQVSYPSAMKKVFYLGAFAGTKASPRNLEIPDPNLKTIAEIRNCYSTLERCAQKLTEACQASPSEEIAELRREGAPLQEMTESDSSVERVNRPKRNTLLSYVDPRRVVAIFNRKQQDRGRERYRRAGITASTSLLSKALMIAISFISVPLTVHYLGAERYGIWLTISSMLMWMSLSDFGLTGNALVNVLSGAHGRDDPRAAREFVASAFWALIGLSAIIGSIFLLTFHYISWRAVFRVSQAVSNQELSEACAITLAIFTASLPLSMLNSIYNAYQDGFILNVWSITGNALALLSLVIVTQFHGGLPLLIGAVSGTRTLVGITNGFYMFYRHYPFLRPKPSAIRLSSFRNLFGLGFKYSITQFAALGIYQSQPMIITQLLGPAPVAIFVIAQKMITLPIDLAYLVTAPFISAFGEAKARNDWPWIRGAFKHSILLSAAVSLIVQLAIGLSAKRIIYVWAGAAAVPDTNLVIWLSIYTFVAAAGMPLGQALCGLERAGSLALSLSLCALAIVALSLVSAPIWGLAGVAAAMAISKTFIALPIQLRDVRRTLKAGQVDSLGDKEGDSSPVQLIA